jgi:hypothetical protein
VLSTHRDLTRQTGSSSFWFLADWWPSFWTQSFCAKKGALPWQKGLYLWFYRSKLPPLQGLRLEEQATSFWTPPGFQMPLELWPEPGELSGFTQLASGQLLTHPADFPAGFLLATLHSYTKLSLTTTFHLFTFLLTTCATLPPLTLAGCNRLGLKDHPCTP